MILRSLLICLLLVPGVCCGQSTQDAMDVAQLSAKTPDTVDRFLQQHCVRCHGQDDPEADFRIANLSADFSQIHVAEQWTEILNRLYLGDMPPAEEPQPASDEQASASEWIAKRLKLAAAARGNTDGRVVLRRLNKNEYRRTIQDLFGVDIAPVDKFPEDPPSHGFDNIGSALTVSPLHIEKYLEAARDIVETVIVEGDPPPSHLWRMEVETAHRSNQFEGRRSAGDNEMWTPDPVSHRHRYLIKGGGQSVQGGFLVQKTPRDDDFAGFRWFKIPHSGTYRIRIRAAGKTPGRSEVVEAAKQIRLRRNRNDEWKDKSPEEAQQLEQRWLTGRWLKLQEHFQSDPIYEFGSPRMKVATDEGKTIGVVTVDASPEQAEVYEFLCEFERSPGDLEGINILNDYRIPPVLENSWFQRRAEFPRPELWIDWVELEGPISDPWPATKLGRSVREIADASADEGEAATEQAIGELLSQFSTKAFRRPATAGEVERFLDLYRNGRQRGGTVEQAIRVPMIAILTSPHFLFQVESSALAPAVRANQPDGSGRLTDYQIAVRLAYFLWGRMPDDELFRLAEEQQLRRPKVLQQQVDRMLADGKVSGLVSNFTDQWLGLREVGANPPVDNLFPHYDDHLERSMVEESRAFFREILSNDLSVLNFIRSDFVTVNQRMARFYGIPGVRGDHFRKVPITPATHRGGVMTQASVLCVTSNGTRTSPVLRGVWILENILGTPPPPPPPDAGDIKPKVPGINKATVRDRLEAHRKIAACASCHRKIDPLGFALEKFAADGRWREQEGFGYNGRVSPEDPTIDTSGQLPDGRRFDGVRQLQEILLTEEDQFLNCLIKKMMTYALGRGVEYTDHEQITQIRLDMQSDGRTLRRMIKGIVLSPTFQSK